MTVVIHGVHADINELIERRRALGQDGSDEVWDGVYHMAPHAHVHHAALQMDVMAHLLPRLKKRGYVGVGEFNLGPDKHNFRVPDFGALESLPDLLYVPTAIMVGEILSPDDASFAKFGFYASQGVREILIVDPDARSVYPWALQGDGKYTPSPIVTCVEMQARELTDLIDWP